MGTEGRKEEDPLKKSRSPAVGDEQSGMGLRKRREVEFEALLTEEAALAS